ncbi:hypothetical protein [Siminovitchia sp. 179-K 8D1 HS]
MVGIPIGVYPKAKAVHFAHGQLGAKLDARHSTYGVQPAGYAASEY